MKGYGMTDYIRSKIEYLKNQIIKNIFGSKETTVPK
jgi:hypothetical protein